MKRIIIKLTTIILILLIGIGVVARSVEVINKNYLWGFDHGREYLMVRDIIENRNPILIGTPLGAGSAGIQGIFHGPGYYYLLTIPYILFGGDPYGGLLLMYAYGVSALVVFYLLSRKIFPRLGALLATAFISLSPEIIAQSRSLWSPHPSTLFIVLCFYFTYLFLSAKDKKMLFIFLSAFFGGFIYNFEFAIAIPITLSLIFLSIFTFKKTIKPYMFLIGGFIAAYLPMMLFEVRHNFMAVNGILKYLTTHETGKNKTTFVANSIDHFWSFLYNVGNTFPAQSVIPALIIFALIAIPFVYLVRKEKAPKKTFFIWLSSLPIITFFVLSFLRNTVYHYYLYHLNVVYIFLFAYVIVGLYKIKKMRVIFYLYCIVVAFFFISAIPKNTAMITYDIADYGGDAKIKGKTDAIDFIYKDAKGEKFGLLIFTPPVYTYPYDYLIEWYGVKKYGYKPHKEKKGTFYLLMEVDGSKPWSYRGWMETVVKDGEVVFEKRLTSGIIIQKRIMK